MMVASMNYGCACACRTFVQEQKVGLCRQSYAPSFVLALGSFAVGPPDIDRTNKKPKGRCI